MLVRVCVGALSLLLCALHGFGLKADSVGHFQGSGKLISEKAEGRNGEFLKESSGNLVDIHDHAHSGVDRDAEEADDGVVSAVEQDAAGGLEESGSGNASGRPSGGNVNSIRKIFETAPTEKPSKKPVTVPRGERSVKDIREDYEARDAKAAALDALAKEQLSPNRPLSEKGVSVAKYFADHVLDTTSMTDEELKKFKDLVVKELEGLEWLGEHRMELDEEAERRLNTITRLMDERERMMRENPPDWFVESQARKAEWDDMKKKYGDVIKELVERKNTGSSASVSEPSTEAVSDDE